MSLLSFLKRKIDYSIADDEAELEALAENSDEELRSAGIVNPFRREPQPRSVETPTSFPTAIKQPPEAEWLRERSALLARIEQLEREQTPIEELRREMHAARLSADRQKRALSDRATDLEMQCENLRAENERLTDMLTTATRSRQHDEPATGSDELNALRAENERLSGKVEALLTKTRMTDVMLNDLTRQAAQARKDLAEARARLTDSGLAPVDTDAVKALNDTLDLTTSQLRQAERELDAATCRITDLEKEVERLSQGGRRRKKRNEPKKRDDANRQTRTGPQAAEAQPPKSSDDGRQMSLF